MMNIYTAQYIAFNWWVGIPLIMMMFLALFPGMKSIFIDKKRFFASDRYGLFFVFIMPVLLGLFKVTNDPYFSNSVLLLERLMYEGRVNISKRTQGSEFVTLNNTAFKRVKYEYTYHTSHCWQGSFTELVEVHPNAIVRIEVAWLGDINEAEQADRYKDAFPCILKVDVVTNAA